VEQIDRRQLARAAPLAGGSALARVPKVASLPWPLAPARGFDHGDTHSPDDPGDAGMADVPVVGVERRLVRRAEALWEQIRGTRDLPPGRAATLFAAPPFESHSLELAFPPHGDLPGEPLPRIGRLGQVLGGLSPLSSGPVRPDMGRDAPLPARLAALAERALLLKAPVHVEVDSPRDGRAAAPMPGILLRAVALPFRAPVAQPPAGPTVILVASWRQMLSEQETRDLHRELAAAADWMKGQG
jgi:hypothetical protein